MSAKVEIVIKAAILLGILIAINVISNYKHGYIDLTEDKRFTLTDASVKTLKELKEPVFIKVLLEGKFPAGFKRLRNATEELVKDLNDVTGTIDYDFQDPNEGNPEDRKATLEKLKERGIYPMRLTYVEDDQRVDRMTYPYAVVTYGPRTAVVQLLEEQIPGQDQEVGINNSISLLEYKFVSALQKLREVDKKNIVITTGQDEIERKYLYRLEGELRRYYDVAYLNLDSIVLISDKIDLVIVPGPKSAFSYKDQFKLDHYIMHGGKVIWMIDQLHTRLDSIAAAGVYSPTVVDHGLDDLFFNYGVRVETNAVMDYQSTTIPQVVGYVGEKAQLDQKPWFFHPLIVPRTGHPIVKNIGQFNPYFPSTITVLETPLDVTYTTLLETSPKSRYKYVPMQLTTRITEVDAQPALFNKGPQPIAVLAEGTFSSAFKNRVTNDLKGVIEQVGSTYRAESYPTKQIWISDSDFVKNRVDEQTGQTTEIGFNYWTRNIYKGNETFIANAVEYLVDDDNVLTARAKEVKLRLLDPAKTRDQKRYYQILNVALPLVLLALFGLIFTMIRRRRFAR
jgi:ABC-2 type transport system permease protein